MALYGSSPDIPKYAATAQIVFFDCTGMVVGGSTPIEIEHRVTLVGSPNEFAHQRLMQAVNNIVPEAAEGIQRAPDSLDSPPNFDGHHATEAPMPPHVAEEIKWGGTD